MVVYSCVIVLPLTFRPLFLLEAQCNQGAFIQSINKNVFVKYIQAHLLSIISPTNCKQVNSSPISLSLIHASIYQICIRVREIAYGVGGPSEKNVSPH